VADILPFKKPTAKPKQSNTLCRNGHHQWVIDKSKQFDVKQGRLITTSVCARCGKRKVERR